MKLNDEGKGLVESFGEVGREMEAQRQGKEKPVCSYFSWDWPAFQDSERTWSVKGDGSTLDQIICLQ